MLAESSAPIRPPIDFGDRDPTSLLAADGFVFGGPEPETVLAADGIGSDPLVQRALARTVYSAETGEELATLLAVVLEPGVFTSAAAVNGFVGGLATGLIGTDDPPMPVPIGGFDGFAASSGQRSIVAFRVDNVVVMVEADSPATAGAVGEAVAVADSTGAGVDSTTMTPFSDVDPFSVFSPLAGFEFAVFPTDEEKVDLPFEPLPVPTLDGLAGFPVGELVVIGNEIRGAAWAVPVSRASYASAEDLIEPMRNLAATRSGGAATEQVIAGRTVYGGDAVESIRVFRHENLVLVVDGFDRVNADAIVAAWARSVGSV